MQQVGSSIGTAVLSSIFASAVTASIDGRRPTPQVLGEGAVHGYTVAFCVSAGTFAVGAVLVGALMRPIRVQPDRASRPVAEPVPA